MRRDDLGRSDDCDDFIEEETGVNISDNLGKCGAENLESFGNDKDSEGDKCSETIHS
jgi:hypothetical protein